MLQTLMQLNGIRMKRADWGVDGWKEDTMLTGGSGGAKVYHDGAWNAPMKALHERGDYVMARNAYVSSPGSIQRLNDTHGEQDRIPQLVLSMQPVVHPMFIPTSLVMVIKAMHAILRGTLTVGSDGQYVFWCPSMAEIYSS